MKIICPKCGEIGKNWERRMMNNYNWDMQPTRTMAIIRDIENHPCKFCGSELSVIEGQYNFKQDGKPLKKGELSGKEWLKVGKKLKQVKQQTKQQAKDMEENEA